MKRFEDRWYIGINTYKVYCFWENFFCIIIYCAFTLSLHIQVYQLYDYSNSINYHTICVLPIVFFQTQIAIFIALLGNSLHTSSLVPSRKKNQRKNPSGNIVHYSWY